MGRGGLGEKTSQQLCLAHAEPEILTQSQMQMLSGRV